MSNRNASLSPAVALRSGDIVVAQRAYISIAQVGDTGIVVDAPASMRCHPGTLVLVTNGGYIAIEAEDVKPTGHRLEGASFELCNAARVSGTLERIVLSDKAFAEAGQSIRVHLWSSAVEITPVFRVRIAYKHPRIRTASQPGGDDFETECDWRNRVQSLMSEIHEVGNDADELTTCEGIDVVGLDPYVTAEFSDRDQAQLIGCRICELIAARGGELVSAESEGEAPDDSLRTAPRG